MVCHPLDWLDRFFHPQEPGGKGQAAQIPRRVSEAYPKVVLAVVVNGQDNGVTRHLPHGRAVVATDAHVAAPIGQQRVDALDHHPARATCEAHASPNY